MESAAVDSSVATQAAAIQATEKTTEKTNSSSVQQSSGQSSVNDEFATLMKKALGDNKSEVSEEELFAGLIQEQLQKDNPEAADYYASQVTSLKSSMARADGKVSMEDVGKAALKACVTAGKIDNDAAELVNAKAFSAAQT